MTTIDIHEPVQGEITTRHTRTKDLKTYMDRQRTKLSPGTRLYAYVGKSTYHFILKDLNGSPWWDLERQVIG